MPPFLHHYRSALYYTTSAWKKSSFSAYYEAASIKIQKKLKILWQFLSGCGIIIYSFAKIKLLMIGVQAL
jgi:hypothetical protein